jgi:hypothetical protein
VGKETGNGGAKKMTRLENKVELLLVNEIPGCGSRDCFLSEELFES